MNEGHLNLKRARTLIENAIVTLALLPAAKKNAVSTDDVFDEDLVYAKALLGQAPPRVITIPKDPTQALRTRLERLRSVCKLFIEQESESSNVDMYWMFRLVDQITSTPRVSIYVRSSIILSLRHFNLTNAFEYVLDMFVQFGVRSVRAPVLKHTFMSQIHNTQRSNTTRYLEQFFCLHFPRVKSR